MKQEFIDRKINIGNLQIHVLLSSGFFYVDEPWSMPLHAHAAWEMHYIYRGEVEFDVQNMSQLLHAGELALVPPYRYHCVKGHTPKLRKTSLIFSLSENKTADSVPDQYTYYTQLLQQLDGLMLLQPESAYFQALLQCITEYTESGQLHQERFAAVLKLIFVELAELVSQELRLPGAPRSPFPKEEGGESFIRKKLAEDFIYHRFQEQITVEDLANYLHLSVRQTNRFLKENMQIGFHEFVREYRIQLARTLLTEYHMELQEVAYTVGYRSYQGFAEAFKKTLGVSPAQYLKHKSAVNL